MQKSLSSRLEALEQATGVGRTVRLTFACPICGEPLEADDRGSACRTHPRIKRADINLLVSFVTPQPRTEATEATA